MRNLCLQMVNAGDCLVESGIGVERKKYPVKWYLVISESQRLRSLMNEDGKMRPCLFDQDYRDEWERHDRVSLRVARTQRNSQTPPLPPPLPTPPHQNTGNGKRISHVETWQRDSTNSVYGKLGHQDSFRRGEIAKVMESPDTHGWLIAALLREMSGLEGKAMFVCVESSFTFNRCLRQESVEAPRLWQLMAAQRLASVEGTWKQKNMGLLLDF